MVWLLVLTVLVKYSVQESEGNNNNCEDYLFWEGIIMFSPFMNQSI